MPVSKKVGLLTRAIIEGYPGRKPSEVVRWADENKHLWTVTTLEDGSRVHERRRLRLDEMEAWLEQNTELRSK
jgi:hypothetical protein